MGDLKTRCRKSNSLRSHLGKLKKLDGLLIGEEILKNIPLIKIERFSEEAKTFDIWRMQRFSPDKRYTFVLCLFKTSKSQVLDDLGEMLVKRLRKLHNEAQVDLAEWRAKLPQNTPAALFK